MLPMVTFSQTAVIHKSYIQIGTKVFHGCEKNGRYQSDSVLEWTFGKPIRSGSAYDISDALDRKAKKLKIFHCDDNGKWKVSHWIGKLPEAKDIKDKGSRKPKKAEEVEDAEPVVPKGAK